MEILQPVRARGQRWRVADLRAFEHCQLLTLAQSERAQRVLTPFDDVDPIRRLNGPKRAGPRHWRDRCRALLASDTPPAGLRTAARADIELLPHQLAPALAVLRGAGSRVLLADDVGLGKTIQAGLIVAELLARGSVERVLILAPAALIDQWSSELHRRFGIEAARGDAASLRRLAANLPLGVNPWQTMPIAIASIDYFKRLEVLPAAAHVRWDVVVLDEAHAAAGDSDRFDAARLVAEQAAYVILMTATPHCGDQPAFDQLCGIGDPSPVGGQDDRLIVFRRTRAAIRGDTSRRIHVLHVRQSTAERHMHEALGRYRRAVTAEHGERALALSVLEKRALSSPWSLAQSIDRRLAAIAGSSDAAALQLPLPLADPDGELLADDAPPCWPAKLALADAREDRRLLAAIAAAARTAALNDDSKLRRLRRLLRRARESALVFTEYRDSALHIQSALGGGALLLHGGMDREQRREVMDVFTRSGSTVLVATDAAAQGLNLHERCRLVVNVELPWNPMKLEQRIGRVDRIGQTRRVHAFHLVAADTSEPDILARLKERIARAWAAIAAPDPVGFANRSSDRPLLTAIADAAMEGATREAERLAQRRTIMAGGRQRPSADEDRALLLRARRWRLKAALAGRTLLIYRLTCEDGGGHPAESQLVSLLVEGTVTNFDAAFVPDETTAAWHREVSRTLDPFNTARLVRERAIAARLAEVAFPLFQPALFDGRAERARIGMRTEQSDALHAARLRIEALERKASISAPAVRLVLVARP